MSDAPAQTAGSSSGQRSISSSMLDRLRIRDAAAWNRLVDLFTPVVYQWCRQRELQPSDAADMVQDVFQAVALNLDGFRRESPGDTFRGWLWTITQNKIRDHFRQRAKHPQGHGGTEANLRLHDLPDGEIENTQEPSVEDTCRLVTRRAMELIRNDFNDNTWQAFWRMTVDGHASADIAADLGMTKEAVRKAKQRVLKRLREELDGLL